MLPSLPTLPRSQKDPQNISGNKNIRGSSPEVGKPGNLGKTDAEKLSVVLKAIRTIENRSVYATLPQLEFSTGIKQDVLDGILANLEKEGVIFQYKQGAWKLVR